MMSTNYKKNYKKNMISIRKKVIILNLHNMSVKLKKKGGGHFLHHTRGGHSIISASYCCIIYAHVFIKYKLNNINIFKKNEISYKKNLNYKYFSQPL